MRVASLSHVTSSVRRSTWLPIRVLAGTVSQNDPTVPKPLRYLTFWQHTESGKCPGITGNCDMNVFNGILEQLAKLTIPTPAKAGEGVASRSKAPQEVA
ncbi:MAG: hypothetical protein IPI39_16655 [Candidatus Obscuribacter sp.]|nr:hypothetical protein [Candidatus Obscuribacter sp.]